MRLEGLGNRVWGSEVSCFRTNGRLVSALSGLLKPELQLNSTVNACEATAAKFVLIILDHAHVQN